jgi:hypothetical protein
MGVQGAQIDLTLYCATFNVVSAESACRISRVPYQTQSVPRSQEDG